MVKERFKAESRRLTEDKRSNEERQFWGSRFAAACRPFSVDAENWSVMRLRRVNPGGFESLGCVDRPQTSK